MVSSSTGGSSSYAGVLSTACIRGLWSAEGPGRMPLFCSSCAGTFHCRACRAGGPQADSNAATRVVGTEELLQRLEDRAQAAVDAGSAIRVFAVKILLISIVGHGGCSQNMSWTGRTSWELRAVRASEVDLRSFQTKVLAAQLQPPLSLPG